jgi:hypothetical protein
MVQLQAWYGTLDRLKIRCRCGTEACEDVDGKRLRMTSGINPEMLTSPLSLTLHEI